MTAVKQVLFFAPHAIDHENSSTLGWIMNTNTFLPLALLEIMQILEKGLVRGVGNEQFWRTRFPDFSLISP